MSSPIEICIQTHLAAKAERARRARMDAFAAGLDRQMASVRSARNWSRRSTARAGGHHTPSYPQDTLDRASIRTLCA